MAYGLRLRIEYKDINEVLTRINISQDGYSGVADVRYAHAGIRVEWGDQGNNALPLVYGSSCTIFFDAEFDYEFLYLFSSDARAHLVEVEKAGVLFWKGYIEPDSWTEPLITTPYPVQCTAYDGLGFLKDTLFVDDAEDDYEGKKTLFEILQICLLKTGLSLNINTAIDWEEELQTPGTDLLKIHSSNCANYTGLSCYEVLEAVFKECRIQQRGGQWWVISNTNFTFNTIYYFRTTPAGVETSGSFNPVAEGYWFENSADMNILPGLKELTIIQDYGYTANLVQNGSFGEYNNNTFDKWTNINVFPQQRDLNKDGDKFVYIPGKQYPDSFGDEGYGLITYGILNDNFKVKQSTAIFKMGFSYALVGTAYSSLMFARVCIVGDTESFYLRRERYYETSAPKWEWINYEDQLSQGDDHICLKSHSKVSAYTGITLPHPYYNTFDNVTAWPLDKVADHFEKIQIVADGIPISGTLQIYLYVPYTDRPQITGSAYTGVSVELLDEEEEKYPESKKFRIINTARNNYVPEQVTATLGDYPVNNNADTIYSGGISRADGSHTTGWKVGGFSYYTFAELIGRLMASQQRDPRQSYRVRVADLVPSLAMIIEDANNPGRRFVEHGIVYDDAYAAAEGRYTEVLELSFTGQTVETETIINTPATGTGGGTTTERETTTTNIEERVLVMDEKSAVVSAPGYLDAEFFEPILDEETGATRIRPLEGILVDQEAHGFVVGDLIRHNGTIWVKAQADTAANAATAIVNQIIDVDIFRCATTVFLKGFDCVAGSKYFLSVTTAGAMFVQSEPETWTEGNYRQLIGTGTETGLLVEIDEGRLFGEVDWTEITNKPTTFPPSAHEHEIADVTGLQTALDNKLETSLKGSVNGLAELDENGFVLNAQLPSYVDDVIERADFASLPIIGESGKIYITTNDNKTYRWSGSTYAIISDTLALGETYATAYRGDRGKIAYDYSQIGHVTLADSRISQWEAAYSARISSLTNVGNSGAATLVGNVLNIPNYTLAGLGAEPAFSKNTAFNKNFGTTAGTILEGRTFGTAANSAVTDFAPASGSANYVQVSPTSAQSGNIWMAGSARIGETIYLASGAIENKFQWLGYNGAYARILSNVGYDANYNAVVFRTNSNENNTSQGNTLLSSWEFDLGGFGDPDCFKINRSPAGSWTFSNLFKISGSGDASILNSFNSPSYKLSGVDLYSSLSANTLQKWDGAKHTSIANASGYLHNDGSGNMSFGAITGFLPLAGGELTGGLTGTTANFSGAATAASFILGSTGWAIEVVSGKLAIKYSGTSLLSLDSSGNLKVAGDGYGGGL